MQFYRLLLQQYATVNGAVSVAAPIANPGSVPLANPAPAAALPPDENIPNSRRNTKKRGGDQNLSAREGIKSEKTTKGKLMIMLQIKNERAQRFCITTLNPVLGCFEHHCQLSFDAFEQ